MTSTDRYLSRIDCVYECVYECADSVIGRW